MKTIIVSEKPIAGEKIASYLSNGKFNSQKESNAPIYTFMHNKFGDVFLIPLKGHISDVDFPPEVSNWYKTNISTLALETPILYLEKEKSIIKLLKKYAKDLNLIIVATDADREGESIGREAVEYVKSINSKVEVKRAYFSAITKDEINKSFNELHDLNYSLADAADARREIDLVWGAALTRFLSLSTKSVGRDFLSVGRVQSPTLAKIVEKELEIESFVSTPYFEIEITVKKDNDEFIAKHKKDRFLNKDEAQKAYDETLDSGFISDIKSEKKVVQRPIPFNTTDFLRAASSLGFDTMKAMEIAEKLYMEGFVSYPRTDNQVYEGIDLLETLNKLNQGHIQKEVTSILELKKIEPSKGKLSKDHPPIYPVDYLPEDKFSKNEQKIYKLILDRFLATLSEDAITYVTKVEINSNKQIYVSKGTIIEKKGWMRYYQYNKLKEEKLPNLVLNENINIINKELLSKQTKPPQRYSQGTLIKLMEDLNLGTKSTRPAIIEKLYSRGYVSGKKQIVPSPLAISVILSLRGFADDVIKPDMTALLEDEMNRIESQNINKVEVVSESRNILLKIVDDLTANKSNIASKVREGKLGLEDFGVCSKCSSNLKKRKSKNGKFFVGCSNYPNCTNSYPLPQIGDVKFSKQYCDICKSPIAIISNKNGKFSFCISIGCANNKWKELEDV